MARDISAKGRAARLDPAGYKRPSALVRARPIATLVVCVAAAAWVALAGRPGGDQAIYMPGPVAAAHAGFANACTTCHDGGTDNAGMPAGAFDRGVSDTACLKCHEAPVHHANQTDLRHGMSSANCESCHVEHRGRPALTAVTDSTCTACHADLTGRSTHPKPTTSTHVTAFASSGHPRFGRWLRGADGEWSDPTRLRFNHKVHFEQQGAPQLQNCATCHSTADATEAAAGETLTRSYMRPVSYDRNCKSCHAITVPGVGAVALAHDHLSVVRAQLNAMPALIDEAVTASAGAAAAGGDAVARVQEQLDHVTEAVRTVSRENKQSFEPITAFVRSRAAGDPAAVKATTTDGVVRGGRVTQPHPKRVEWAVVFASEGRCTKCHDVRGEVVPGYAEPSRPPAADSLVPSWETLQAPPGTALETVPTGIGSAPRRWFPNARFDHRSHRSAACLDCHADVQQSTKTADLSLPDLTSRPTGRPSARSCVDCHHTGSTAAAPATCVTCHDFHNSRLERAPDGQRGVWDLLRSITPAAWPSTDEVVVPKPDALPPTSPTDPAPPATTAAPNPVPPAPTPAVPDLPPPPDLPPAPAPDLPPPPDLPLPDLPPPP